MVISIYKCNSHWKSELRLMRMFAKAGCDPNVFISQMSTVNQ